MDREEVIKILDKLNKDWPDDLYLYIYGGKFYLAERYSDNFIKSFDIPYSISVVEKNSWLEDG